MTDGPTDRPTDRPTDGPTKRGVESCSMRLKRLEDEKKKKIEEKKQCRSKLKKIKMNISEVLQLFAVKSNFYEFLMIIILSIHRLTNSLLAYHNKLIIRSDSQFFHLTSTSRISIDLTIIFCFVL